MSSALTVTRIIAIGFIATFICMMSSKSAFAIVGGVEAQAGEQNWMVGVALANEPNGYYAQFCGGTLIDREWVLTAAHCTVDEYSNPFEANDLNVIVGRTTLSSNDGQRVAVAQIIVHKDFNLFTYDNDIALLRLSQPIENVETLPLAGRQTRAIDTAVYGWGQTQNGHGADTLKMAKLPVVSSNTCQMVYGRYGILLSKSMVCAGVADGSSDSCTGDSGGPLVGYDEGKPVQVGIVSFGLECGVAGLSGVYTSVAGYSAWVALQMTLNG